jgi:hypothetical protein
MYKKHSPVKAASFSHEAAQSEHRNRPTSWEDREGRIPAADRKQEICPVNSNAMGSKVLQEFM